MAESCIGSNGNKWEICKDSAGEWRWRRTAKSEGIVNSSFEGYKNKADCISNAKRNGMNCTPR